MAAAWLDRLERRLAEGGEEELAIALVSLAFAAARGIELPDGERRGAARRALLVLAAGGDPARGLDLEGRAVTALATDLETPERVAALQTGLDELAGIARGFPHVSEALHGLRETPDVAWRAFAAAILANELEND